MHRPELIEDETAALSEGDREEFAARNDSGLDADIVSSPLVSRRQGATSEKSHLSTLLPFWGVMMVGVADWMTSRALGTHLVLSLLMVIPIYVAARVVGTKSGMAVAGIGGLFCLVIDVFVLSAPQVGFLHVGLAGTHLALYATAIAWAMERRRLLAERAMATTDVPTGGANRRGFYQRIALSSPRQAAHINASKSTDL
jgi:hypothetical protein